MAKIKGVQVSATVSNELNAALENHRWDVRKTKAEVVKTAIEEYVAKHGIEVQPGSEPAADQDAESVHQSVV